MSEPRRHHILSKSLFLRRFTNQDGKLWVHNKRQPDRVYPANPDKAFVVTDLNTIEEKDGTRNTGLEKWYAEFEGKVAPIIERIVERARASKKPELSIDEKNLWDNFVYHQQKRAPDAFDRLGLVQDFANDLPKFIEEFERTVRPLIEAEKAELADPEVQARMIQRAKVVARGSGGAEVIEFLAQRGLVIGIVTSPKKSFVIGDHPFARMGPDPHLGHERLELWLPVSADVAVSPWGEAGTEALVRIEPDHVRRINEVIFRQSNVTAARSEALLRSLADLK